MLAFLDLETCGLDVEGDDILEVACIVTDDRLATEVARYHAVVRTDREFYELPEVVRDMHTKSGLWSLDRSEGRQDRAADQRSRRCRLRLQRLSSQRRPFYRGSYRRPWLKVMSLASYQAASSC